MSKYADLTERPTAKYHRDEQAFALYLSQQYMGISRTIQKELAFNPNNVTPIRQVELMKQIEIMVRGMHEPMAEFIDDYIGKSFMEGRAYHMLSVGDAKNMREALGSQSWNRINRGKVEALVSDTYEDILMATKNTEANLKQIVRDNVKKTAQYNALLNNGYKEQAEQLKKELLKEGLSKRIHDEGFVGITDRAGRRWDVGTYSNMVIKTKINDSFKEGVMQRAKDEGMDLAVISSHGAKDDCRKWEGVVISLTGATKGYPTYREARSGNEIFHPNCEHTLHPIRNLDMLHPDDVAEAQKKTQELGFDKPEAVVVPKVDTSLYDNNPYPLLKRKDTDVYQKFGDVHYDKVHGMLQQSPLIYRQLWAKYEGDLKANDMHNGKDGAYYHPATQGVHMNIEKDSKGTTYTTPYQVVYHEFAHNMDYLINKEIGGFKYDAFSHTYKDNIFGKTIKKEFDARVKAMDKVMKQELKDNIKDIDWLVANNYLRQYDADFYEAFPDKFEELLNSGKIKHNRARTYAKLQREITAIPLIERGNLSDIMEGVSKAKVQGGIGHGKSYWNNDTSLPKEAFAEMIDSNIANKPALEQIKKYFPEAYKVFEEMMEYIINL